MDTPSKLQVSLDFQLAARIPRHTWLATILYLITAPGSGEINKGRHIALLAGYVVDCNVLIMDPTFCAIVKNRDFRLRGPS